ncbi:Dethiobiotin synthase [Vitreoscilla filiformis]|uniref:ATP-dependent dethiobiotin synthetase BioD n=1 Tax=Vitreoscilla filiformis TaxID=63 RepID=A0A221KIR8_VITFI|nr:dethiobiotin synthase [Vitreoscilla filiformis]ASM78723.1 Dethiobiotin synthase [Vitreoscilla filiformis]
MSGLPRWRGCFVTGTDTEVGKTHVSAALLHALGSRGLRVAGYKPVAAGTVLNAQGQRINEDVQWLHAASTLRPLALEEVGPCVFDTPCAPHIAARLEGRALRPAELLAGAARLAARVDAVVVEGVGGFCVPLAEPGDDPAWPGGFDSADLAVQLGLPVILVVGVRLGCLNHAQLTAQAVLARGLRLAGWIANAMQPEGPHHAANLAALRWRFDERLGVPCLGELPCCADPSAVNLAQHLNRSALAEVLGLPRTLLP